jgi:formylglycine-generating enzyme required for sulfatase activity
MIVTCIGSPRRFPDAGHLVKFLHRNSAVPLTRREFGTAPRHFFMLVCALVMFIVAFPNARAVDRQVNGLQPGNTFRDCPECPEMVVIPAGKFLMGSSAEETKKDFAAVPGSQDEPMFSFWPSEAGNAKKFMPREHPQHSVSFSTHFGLGIYHVTKREFSAFIHETGYSTQPCILWTRGRAVHTSGGAWVAPGFAQTDRDPVVCVSWIDAKAYTHWLNRKLGATALTEGDGPYRLPSEAEWEYAARAGTETARWWGDTIGYANANCNSCNNSGAGWQTTPDGSFPANAFGLYDMLGNTWQWTEDCWHETYVGAPSDGSPWTSVNCALRAFRGGSWNSSAWILRSATRSGGEPGNATNDGGFRVMREMSQ